MLTNCLCYIVKPKYATTIAAKDSICQRKCSELEKKRTIPMQAASFQVPSDYGIWI